MPSSSRGRRPSASWKKSRGTISCGGRAPVRTVTLECANLTQPNVALIGEEIEAKRMTLAEIVSDLAEADLRTGGAAGANLS